MLLGHQSEREARYTGRQVWNRQRTNRHETVPGDKRSSLGITRDWNPRSDWIVSARRTHPALVSDADFVAAQQVICYLAKLLTAPALSKRPKPRAVFEAADWLVPSTPGG